jgi:superfamily I DNA and/or RNA helicase
LALKIQKTLESRGQKPLAFRNASRETEAKVDDRLRPLLLPAAVTRLMRELTVGCDLRLQEREYPACVKAVLGEWRSYLPGAGPELYDRLRRGASLVYSTCAGATREKVDPVGSFGVYDWVIIEEAAKAWPTELALPLVRGFRWTLIGDYKQLPAYRRNEVKELLASCAASKEPNLRRHGEFQDQYHQVFSLFESLFGPREKGPPAGAEQLDRPLARLNTQYRMRRAIAEVVSEAFYPDVGGLETAPSAGRDSGIVSPGWLAGKALVWLDTGGVEDCVNAQSGNGSWSNAGEARIVAELIQALDPPATDLPHDEDEDPLVVLTPYRAQVDALSGLLSADARGLIWTPHEYQGHEANVVVYSLVRDGSWKTTERGKFGHLIQPELVNVMFSRAKGLLVVVGRFDYYRDSGIEFWRAACEAIRRNGAVLRAWGKQ